MIRRDPWVEHVRAAVKSGRGRREHNLIGFVPPQRLTRRGKARIRMLRLLLARAATLASDR